MGNSFEVGNAETALGRPDLESRLWHYRGRVLRTVDGDTLDLVIDLGFGQQTFHPANPDRPHPLATRIRFDGIDCPEKKGATLQAGRDAQAALSGWVEAQAQSWYEDQWPFIVRTGFSRHLERWIGELWSRSARTSASDFLVSSGHARRVGS